MIKNRRNHGFAIGAILIAIVLIAAIAAMLATAGGDTSSLTDKQRYGLLSSSLISQSNDMVGAIMEAQKNGFPMGKIKMSATACNYDEYCLFNEGSAVTSPAPAAGTLVDDTNSWVLNDVQMTFANAGGDVRTNQAEWVLLLKGINPSVCRQLNRSINNFNVHYDENDFKQSSGGDPVNNAVTAMPLSGGLTDKQRQQGCFFNSITNAYYYYRIIMTN